MSATIQFLVSSPRSSSGSFAVSSPAELESSTDDSRSSWLLFCARTASWAYHSAIAGVTLPPVSALSYYAEQTPQVNCLHTSARILQDCRLSLIHIPLPLYPHFVHALLSLILPEASAKPDDANDYSSNPDSCVATDFVNISVTPVECSVVCSQLATERFFVPVINSLDPSVREDVAISPDEFVAIQVDGEGLDAGQRVLDLTSPLAQAKV